MTLSTSFLDFPSPSGIAVILFFEGCDFSCPNCQNKYLQKHGDNSILLSTLYDHIISYSIKNYAKQIVFSGGDPLSTRNRNTCFEILHFLNKHEYKICIYTGYSIDEIKKFDNEIPLYTYIKCGIYDESKKQESKKTDEYISLASTNQELYYKTSFGLNKISKNGIYYFNKGKIWT
jgi:organic radical activating enzyme